MLIVPLESAAARDPRLAVQLADRATGAAPAWLWSTDGSRIMWTNAVGAAIFGAANAGDCATRRFDAKHPAAVEVARLAATLPPPGQARLERLRGFGASFGRALTCVCSRVALGDGAAVFVAANEPAGPALSLRERVSRLFTDPKQVLAVFAQDGTFLCATEAARSRIGASPTLSTLGVVDLRARALAAGNASGATNYGAANVERLGTGDATVLAVAFPAIGVLAPVGEGAAPLPATAAAAAPQASAAGEIIAERRHPLRFVWQMDADGRFMVGSDEFVELIGPRTTAAFGRLWSEIAAELKLDPESEVARAVATHETWSGIVVSWPVDEDGERLPVELSGLPVFDRERNFRGYRGFGVCRDIARINQLARARRARPIGFMPPPERPIEAPAEAAQSLPAEVAQAPVAGNETEPPAEAPGANVVPFRVTPPEPKTPSLSPVERNAFRELAQELTARLQNAHPAGVPENGAPATDETRSETLLSDQPAPAAFESVLLERIPVGVLIYRHDALLYANRHFLELSGYQSLDALAAAGGLHTLFAEPGPALLLRATVPNRCRS